MDRLDLTFAALADPTRRAILARLAAGELTVGELAEPFDISLPAMEQFAANILELRTADTGGNVGRVMVLSESARAALQREKSDAWNRLRANVDDVLVARVPTIERVGGGGVRCMLAEVPEVQT